MDSKTNAIVNEWLMVREKTLKSIERKYNIKIPIKKKLRVYKEEMERILNEGLDVGTVTRDIIKVKLVKKKLGKYPHKFWFKSECDIYYPVDKYVKY